MMSTDRLHRLLQAVPGGRLLATLTGIRRSRDAAHFQRLYDSDSDPWHFHTSDYEQAKYRRTLEALPARRFRSALEVGCSVGVLTHLLAPRCEALLGIDIVETPLHAARELCREQPWVRFQRMQAPKEWPDETYDLIVLSEVLYFLSRKDIAAVADRIRASLDPGGLVLLVNWRGRSDDPCTGEEAATFFIARTSSWLEPQRQDREDSYRLDLLAARDLIPVQEDAGTG